MPIHCLTVSFKRTAPAEAIAAFGAALEALAEQVDVPMRTRQGPALGDRQSKADHAVVSEFESSVELTSHSAYPSHRAVPLQMIESANGVQFVIRKES